MTPIEKPIASPESVMSLIRDSVNRAIDAMTDGQRIKILDFFRLIVEDTGVKSSAVSCFATNYITARPDAYVKRGQKGGVVKGVRREKKDERPRCPTCQQLVRGEALAATEATSLASESAVKPTTAHSLTDLEELERFFATDDINDTEEN